MNRFLLLLCLLISFASVPCVGQITPRLRSVMDADPEAFHRIRIEFKENVDCFALHHEMKQQKLPVDERPKLVIAQLQKQAGISQQPVLELIHGTLRSETRHLHSFWIVNTVLLEATAHAIEQLGHVATVALIDLNDADIVAHDPVIREATSSERSPAGTEPGLMAINAPAMWALGYTGRGRLVYDYDTGVWPTHPAFSERFLAHRFPMEQCWTGFFSDIPNGGISDHGTHTLGTIAGLVEETNDTIGVAFGAYWIANDFVTTTVEELPPLAAMIGAFEWALNPDGDINTTSDIPDVINNSWRWRDDPDTVQCAGMVVNLMNAIEAAGIANVFSGGNSGPANTTVNAPQRINTSEVNTFCVGSINANTNFPYPISNFSTRGPTQCPSNGNPSLAIHPEVVAPGQNVRSAWGTDGFNTISGTSMAAPHVSGAVLLLKEAFPYLSGEELLWALYLTAVDLGDVGEDNTYGMGLIDVHAAFQYLAQNNTPADPDQVAWDLHISTASDPSGNGITCDNGFSSVVSFENRGDSVIQQVEFRYKLNNGPESTAVWSGTLNPGQATDFTLPTALTTLESGDLRMDISASIIGHPNEYDLYNNHWGIEFNRRTPRPLPFIDGFENGLKQNDWLVVNDDGITTWDTIATSGLDWSGYSATVQLYSYDPRSNQRDMLISPLLDIPNTTEPIWLMFDVAYQMRSSSAFLRDTLQILTSVDCGTSFDQPIYELSGEQLSTNDTNQSDFLPVFAWDWRRDSVDLSAYSGEQLMLGFQTINRKGNNIYIDNVTVFVGYTEPNSVTELSNSVLVYPNPTSDVLTVSASIGKASLTDLRVTDMLGRPVPVLTEMGSSALHVYCADLARGTYLLELKINGHRVTKRFIKH